MRAEHQDAGPNKRSVRFSRHLSVALMLGIFAMAIAGAWTAIWMAQRQDEAAEVALRRMVEGGLASFVKSGRKTLIDYASWTEAYAKAAERDLAWLSVNIGGGVDLGSFDAVVLLTPDGTDLGWDAAAVDGPRAGVLDAAMLAAAARSLTEEPTDSDAAAFAFHRSRNAPWRLASPAW